MDEEALNRLANRIDTKADMQVLNRRPLSNDQTTAPRTWDDQPRKRSWIARALFTTSPLEILFIIAMLFFVGALTVSSLLIFSGDNTVSTKNVGIAITGPTTVRAGDVVTLQI